MTPEQLALLTPDEEISLKRCELHKEMADKAAGLFSKRDRASKTEWKRLVDAMDVLGHVAMTTDLPAALDTIAELRQRVAVTLNAYRGEYPCLVHDDEGYLIWLDDITVLTPDGVQHYADAFTWFPSPDAAFAALDAWQKGQSE